jgi:protein-disulfide isomerase
VDVYEDFQCPHCRTLEARDGKELLAMAAGGEARVVYHPLSFLGPESVRAANAAACAADAGKFPEYHAKLFDSQPLEGSGGFTDSDLIGFGEDVGITGSDFASCVTGDTHASWVTGVQDEARRRGVESTPTVFVAGRELPADQMSIEGIRAAVAAAGT